MEAKYDGKVRGDVLKGCKGDESVVSLKLKSIEKTKKGGKCRSQCLICYGAFNNQDETLQEHLCSTKHQNMERMQTEVDVMGQHLAYGGNQHREAVVDSYMLAYFIQKERLPHSTAQKLKRVMNHLHCTDSEKVERVAMSSKTIARYFVSKTTSMSWRVLTPPPPPTQ
jgi:hypothetical protein